MPPFRRAHKYDLAMPRFRDRVHALHGHRTRSERLPLQRIDRRAKGIFAKHAEVKLSLAGSEAGCGPIDELREIKQEGCFELVFAWRRLLRPGSGSVRQRHYKKRQ